MGISIDEHIGVIEDLKSTMSVCMPEPEKTEICTSLSEAIDTMRKYQLLQDNYEARLKADMVAMLTEIQLEIEEKSIIDYDEDLYDGGECVISISEINEIIQQKINKLKENTDGNK